MLRNVDCIALRTESDGILAANPEPPSVLSLNFGGRKRCTLKPCVNMGDGGINVKTVVERVSVNMGDTNIIVKTVVERVSVNMGDRGLSVKTVYEPKTISIMI